MPYEQRRSCGSSRDPHEGTLMGPATHTLNHEATYKKATGLLTWNLPPGSGWCVCHTGTL